MINWMLDTIAALATAVFGWLDHFGREHWGFILAVVFLLYLLDRLRLGLFLMGQRVRTWRQHRLMMHYGSLPQRIKPAAAAGITTMASGFGNNRRPAVAHSRDIGFEAKPSVLQKLQNSGLM